MMGSVQGPTTITPSPAQTCGKLAEHLVLHGRLTMPQAGRVASGRMLGDWRQLSKSRRKYFMDKAQRALINLSRVMPIYPVYWHADKGYSGRIRAWYYMNKEPIALLRRDLRRPGADVD